LVVPLVTIWRSLPPSIYRRAAVIFAAVAIWYGLAFKLEADILDPILFPQAQARELVMPHAPKEKPR
jgi:hypothetical protein